MSALRIACVATAFIALAGCQDKNTPAPIAPQDEGVIPQGQLNALKKTKDLENTLNQNEQQRREQIDQ